MADVVDVHLRQSTPGISACARYEPHSLAIEVQFRDPDRLHGSRSVGAAQFRKRCRRLMFQGPFGKQR
ncbi:MAG: hypothetical protein V3W34_15420 [Phycisphaerae bacterium]